jgi:alpha-L-fucosidase
MNTVISNQVLNIARPTPQQLAWADCEIGVIIHLDMPVFEPSYSFREKWGYTPSPAIFNPSRLDTDQWMDVASAAGAGYAVLVAKHCSGFCLWPTDVHEYSVKKSPWKNGAGDVVGDFIRSCERYHIKPGLYYSMACNAYMQVDNPGLVRSGDATEQRQYNDMAITQLTELWTRYGDLFEIWFDGGVIPAEQGGPDLTPLLAKHQPNAVVFQGPREHHSLIRWVGNERGVAPDPCWCATESTTKEGGEVERRDLAGAPGGSIWCPAEADMPNRDSSKAFGGGWFWRDGEDNLVYPVEHLVDCYHTSVGRGCNLLLGMVIDSNGQVPEADVKQMRAFGREINRRYSQPLVDTQGRGTIISQVLDYPVTVNAAVITEDICSGQRIEEYALDGLVEDKWVELSHGSSVGHKKIDCFESKTVSSVRLRVLKTYAGLEPQECSVRLFCHDQGKNYENPQI